MKLKNDKTLIHLAVSLIRHSVITFIVMNVKNWWLSLNVKILFQNACLEKPIICI